MKSVLISISLALLAFVMLRMMVPDGIIFYQGVVVSAASATAHWALYRRRRPNTSLLESLLVFFAIYSFIFTVPTTVDRAYSVRLLEQLASQHQGMTRPEVEAWFSEEFKNGDAVQKRLSEQIATGSIEMHGERYTLTRKGKLLNNLFKTSCGIFRCHLRSRSTAGTSTTQPAPPMD